MCASRDWSTLPPTALINVLSRFHWEDVFTSCALVCRTWAEATVEAQTDLYLSELDEDRLPQFKRWLWQKGHRLTLLHIDTVESVEALPCPNLQCLSLECYGEPMTAGFGFLLHMAAATRLTSISFDGVEMCVARWQTTAAFDVLAQLPSLQCLTWINIHTFSEGSHTAASAAHVSHPGPPASFCQRATALTYLHADWRCTDNTFQHVSCLQRLQQLVLSHLEDVTAAGLTGLKVGGCMV